MRIFAAIKQQMKKAIFIVEKTNTGFSAYAENYGASTTGGTYKELKKNMLLSLNTLLEYEEKKLATANDIVVKFDMQQFFEYYSGVDIVGISKKIGISKPLIKQYRDGVKYTPEPQAFKIIKGMQSYGKELANIKM